MKDFVLLLLICLVVGALVVFGWHAGVAHVASGCAPADEINVLN